MSTHVDEAQPATLTNAWKQALLCTGAVLALFFWVYFDTFAVMAYTWWHFETYTHGMLIMPISAYLIWERRKAIAQQAPQPFAPGLILVLLSAGFWLVSAIAGVQLFMQVAFFAILISLLLSLLGLNFFRLSLFPLGYLFFAVPFGEQLVPVMMDLTAEFTVAALSLTSIPFYFEGRFITLPTGNWEVAEACSGVRYIIASLALGLLYAYWSYRSWWKRGVFCFLALLVPILANGLRAFGVILLGHFSGMTVAVGVDHLVYGWLFFGLVMFLLFWAGSYWRDTPEPLVTDSGNAIDSAQPELTKRLWLMGSLVIVIAVSAVSFFHYTNQRLTQAHYSAVFPQAAPGWLGPEETSVQWEPNFKGAQLTLRRDYRFEDQQVSVYLVHYGMQQQGLELINSTNVLFNKSRWRVLGGNLGDLDFRPRERWKKTVYKSGGTYRLLAWTYDINGVHTARAVNGKVQEVIAQLTGSRQGSCLIAVSVDYSDDVDTADRLLERFMSEHPEFSTPGSLVQLQPSH